MLKLAPPRTAPRWIGWVVPPRFRSWWYLLPLVVCGISLAALVRSNLDGVSLALAVASLVVTLTAWEFPLATMGVALLVLCWVALFPSYDGTVPAFTGLYVLAIVVARAGRAFAVAAVVGMALALSAALQLWSLPVQQRLATVLPWSVLFAFVIGVGLVARRALNTHRREAQLLAERRARERADLARQLHDTVARANSLMVLQAENGRALANDPEVQRYFGEILELGRSNGQALQALVGALSLEGEPTDEAAGPGVLSLPQFLLQQERKFIRHGFSPEFRVQANLAGVSPESMLWCHRVVAEAMHNVLKYGERGSCRLIVADTDDDRIDIMCVSRVRPDAAALRSGSGFGLSYLRSSLERLGGELVAGPSPSGPHWIFNATVPRSL